MSAKKQASDVNTVHSEVPDNLAAVDNASPDIENNLDDTDEADGLCKGISPEVNNNDNKNNQSLGISTPAPPPIRDVGYWWISLICILMGIGGPFIYYIESLNIADGRYFQALTSLTIILICCKLFTFCKYDLEVNSIIGIIVLWSWLFYGVVEWGRILITGNVAILVGVVHIIVLLITKQPKLQCIVTTTGVEFWIWVSVIICVILPVNIATRMPGREGIVLAHLYLIVWFLEMLYQGLVERDVRAADVFFKSLPVLRLPIYISAIYVLCFLAWRVFKCFGVEKQYELPKRIKTTPMSLYEGTDKMFPEKVEQKQKEGVVVADDLESKKGLVNRKRVVEQQHTEEPQQVVSVVKKDEGVKVNLPRPMVLGQTVGIGGGKLGIPAVNPFSVKYTGQPGFTGSAVGFNPVRPSVPQQQPQLMVEQKLAGFDLSLLGNR